MIEVRGLRLKIGGFRIRDLDLFLPEGGFHVLLGPTGSGKTLILESIVGLRQFQKGAILIGGEEIQTLPPERRGISYVPQDLALFPHLTVRENLLFGLRIKKRHPDPNKGSGHFHPLIEALRIEHLLDRYPQGLSGGEKQRVALGRALVPSPRLLLLDEPLTALDPALKSELQQLLLALHRSLRFTALHVTHDLEEAYLLGDTITVVIDGKVEQKGRREDVFLRPSSLRVAQFLGLRNLFREKVLDTEGDHGMIRVGFWGREIPLSSRHAPVSLFPGTEIFIYLRPEEVMILREGKPVKESLRHNVFPGTVTRILDRGTYQEIWVQPAGREDALEIHLPNYVFRNLALTEGQKIRIAVRNESFWVIPAASP